MVYMFTKGLRNNDSVEYKYYFFCLENFRSKDSNMCNILLENIYIWFVLMNLNIIKIGLEAGALILKWD